MEAEILNEEDAASASIGAPSIAGTAVAGQSPLFPDETSPPTATASESGLAATASSMQPLDADSEESSPQEESLLGMGFTDRASVRDALVLAEGDIAVAVALLTGELLAPDDDGTGSGGGGDMMWLGVLGDGSDELYPGHTEGVEPGEYEEYEEDEGEARLPMDRQSIEWPTAGRRSPRAAAHAVAGVHVLSEEPTEGQAAGEHRDCPRTADSAGLESDHHGSGQGQLDGNATDSPLLRRHADDYPAPEEPSIAGDFMQQSQRRSSSVEERESEMEVAFDAASIAQQAIPRSFPDADLADPADSEPMRPESIPSTAPHDDTPDHNRVAIGGPLDTRASYVRRTYSLPRGSAPPTRVQSLSAMRTMTSSLVSVASVGSSAADGRELSAEEESDLLAVIGSPVGRAVADGPRRSVSTRTVYSSTHGDGNSAGAGNELDDNQKWQRFASQQRWQQQQQHTGEQHADYPGNLNLPYGGRALTASRSAPMLSAEWVRNSSKLEMFQEMVRMRHDFEV